jgi:error-prone DNA polymerase
MEDRSIIQWDKDDLDTLGLLKVDCLALGMLTAIHRALDLVSEKRGGAMRMQDVPAEDALTYQMIQRADTVGVFQIESRAQMTMLPRLKPTCFYDLVIQVAIVRPGPIQGGMVHPYLRRRAGEEAVEYPSAEIRAATERTLGIPLFQEQVMQIAMAAADFTAGEADQLRRAMGAWRKRGGLEPHQQKLVQRMLAKGYTQEFADRISKQIEGFGSYGFPESHAASFALLVYVSCWLKRHHPDAFLAALLNSQPMGFYAPAQLVRDAREHGVVIRPIDVQVSAWDSTLEEPAKTAHPSTRWDTRYREQLRAVRLGFSRIGGMRAAAAERIVAARSAGPFASVEDLTRRAQLDGHDLKCLAGADALLSLAGHRPDAVWAAAGVDTRPTEMLREARTFEDPVEFATPEEGAEIFDDYATMGLTLRRHPLALLREQLTELGVWTSDSLRTMAEDRQKVRACGIVTHRQQPSTASGVIFATLEDETGTTNIIVWPSIADEQRRALRGSMLLTVDGIWQTEKGVQSLVATQLTDHTHLLQGLRVSSRDFRCNDTFGGSWDSQLAKQLNWFAHALAISRETGEAARELVKTVEGDKYWLHADGSLYPEKSSYSEEPSAQGIKIQLTAKSIQEAAQRLKGVARKYPNFDVEKALAGLEVKTEYLNSPLHFSVEFGGPEAGRSLVKTAFAFATVCGIDHKQCEQAYRYLTDPTCPPQF